MSLTNKELFEYIQDVEEKTHNRITTNVEEISKMKGGIFMAKFIVPIIVVVVGGLLGTLLKIQTDSIRNEIRYKTRSTVSSGSAVSVEWSETEGRMVPVDKVSGEPAEKLREMPVSSE